MAKARPHATAAKDQDQAWLDAGIVKAPSPGPDAGTAKVPDHGPGAEIEMTKARNLGPDVAAKAGAPRERPQDEEPSAKKAKIQAAGREETGRPKGQKTSRKEGLLGKGIRGLGVRD
jgi:hypothetical protein